MLEWLNIIENHNQKVDCWLGVFNIENQYLKENIWILENKYYIELFDIISLYVLRISLKSYFYYWQYFIKKAEKKKKCEIRQRFHQGTDLGSSAA